MNSRGEINSSMSEEKWVYVKIDGNWYKLIHEPPPHLSNSLYMKWNISLILICLSITLRERERERERERAKSCKWNWRTIHFFKVLCTGEVKWSWGTLEIKHSMPCQFKHLCYRGNVSQPISSTKFKALGKPRPIRTSSRCSLRNLSRVTEWFLKITPPPPLHLSFCFKFRTINKAVNREKRNELKDPRRGCTFWFFLNCTHIYGIRMHVTFTCSPQWG